jgi:hypothetical protein
MTRSIRAPLVWAAVILALLAGAYVIVARSGQAASAGQAPIGYVH